jgi:hypothetical protein
MTKHDTISSLFLILLSANISVTPDFGVKSISHQEYRHQNQEYLSRALAIVRLENL